ncbi:SUKH-4 family immunity protein [Streptomyces decoyicus]
MDCAEGAGGETRWLRRPPLEAHSITTNQRRAQHDATLDRTTLEGEFSSDDLLTLPETMVDGIEHAASVDFLRNVGLPVRANPWFDLIDTSRRDLKKVGVCYEDLRTRWTNLPANAADWVLLGMVPYDDIALDVATGVVHCLPATDDEGYALNKDLHSFAHFLYLLEVERPNYDEERAQVLDHEGAERRLSAQMREIDPAALNVQHSRWHEVLEWVSDPDTR